MDLFDPMPRTQKRAVRRALQAAGYEHVAERFEFSLKLSTAPTEAPVPLAAFWQEPFDQFSAALAVRWLEDSLDPQPFLTAIAQDLWAPFAIIARPHGCDLWETLSDSKVDGDIPLLLISESVSYDALPELLALRREQLGPSAVERRKRQWRQMALYEVSTEPDAFRRWAYEPSRERLDEIFHRVFEAARQAVAPAPSAELDADQLRWLIRLLGVRIIWDKQWRDAGSRTSSHDILIDAREYPTSLSHLNERSWDNVAPLLAEVVASELGSIRLNAADGGVLSQFFQRHGLPPSLQKQWRLYPTPPEIAWGMLNSLPIEALPETDRRVWDGTCGSGTFLVAALDRLRAMVPHLSGTELRQYILSTLAGNDLASALADSTRIALDLALGAVAGSEWRVTVSDVSRAPLPFRKGAPTIICSNPPFKAEGRTPDSAIEIIRRYIHILPSGGLIAVLAPRSLLTSVAARSMREELLTQCDLFEVWELPSRAFPGTDLETTAFIGRKRYKFGGADQATIWRTLARGGGSQNIEAVSMTAWRRLQDYPIEPPLALRLTEAFAHHPRLAEYVPEDQRSQGITPGRGARENGDISEQPAPGMVPFLVGRRGMSPFYIPQDRGRSWLDYSSPRLHRPRREYEPLFKSAKVLISRHATWGYSWRIRAAVDRRGIYPSDQFIAAVPLPPLTLEFLAAVFNSALINCWIRHKNPSVTLRVEELTSIPVPRVLDQNAFDRVARAAQRIEEIRAILDRDDSPQDLAILQELRDITMEIDTLIYDLYEVPTSLRDEISRYFLLAGDQRPGFETALVALSSTEPLQSSLIFDEGHAQRMDDLLELRDERGLNNQEESELRNLREKWEKANLVSLRKEIMSGTEGAQGNRTTLNA